MAEQSLEEVLEPLRVEAFFQDYFGKAFLYQKGDGSKFRELLPWSILNQLLAEHRLDHPQLRITKDGESLAPSQIFTYQQSRRNVQIARLRSVDLTRLLREGATLVVDAIDEMYSPLRLLAQNLEKFFHAYVQVNVYSGWGVNKGFDLHWDDHDVFVMQVEGRKEWKIYGQSRKFPLFRDKSTSFAPPTKIIWEGVLESGDLLYIPRGWWHVATALGEPTLHLTFGINNATGLDLLNWIGERLVEADVYRQDLPRFSDIETLRRHLSELKTQLLGLWDDELLTHFFEHQDSIARGRPYFSFPWSATQDVLPPGDNYNIRCVLPRAASLEADVGGTVLVLRAIGKVFRFASGARPILEMLLSGEVIPIRHLKNAVSQTIAADDVTELIRELLREGVVTLEIG